jgi:hypothetical protein
MERYSLRAQNLISDLRNSVLNYVVRRFNFRLQINAAILPVLRYQINDFLKRPNMVCEFSGHCWRLLNVARSVRGSDTQ